MPRTDARLLGDILDAQALLLAQRAHRVAKMTLQAAVFDGRER